jgi:D-sedoheptulose 7-phosphate isomerase
VTSDRPALRTATDYVTGVASLLTALDLPAVMRVGARLQDIRQAGGTIFLAGNGGSAATASHWANDLAKATRRADLPPVRVISLGDQLAWLTALANDEGFTRVFAGQLENLVQPADALVVLSASGNSPNLIEAVRVARAHHAWTLALLGFDGGTLKSIVDDAVWVPTPHGAYGPVEDLHAIVCHILTACLATAGLGDFTVEPTAAPAVVPGTRFPTHHA